MQITCKLPPGVAGLLTLVAIGLWSGAAWAQGSGSSRTNPPQQPRRPQTVEEFSRDFWQFIHKPKSSYTDWKVVATRPQGDETESHGRASKTFANSVAAADTPGLPYGSILVTESTGADPKVVTSVSVMYRVRGSDPANHDWYWIQYLPDGTLARTSTQPNAKPLAGRVTSCVKCHQAAQGGDLVLFNDAMPAPERKEPK